MIRRQYGRELDTLAQKGTPPIISEVPNQTYLLRGNGTDIRNKTLLQKRARRKRTTQLIIPMLVEYASKKGDFERVKSYWNTYHCHEKLHSSDGTLYGKYCKNRWCTLCLAIRKATLINKYHVVLKEWENPYFVTLTIRAIPASKLKYMVQKGMIRSFQLILDRVSKRYRRGKGSRLIGIRSLECNFNPAKSTYNPHFHVIVSSKEAADSLMTEWLKTWTPKHALRQGQHMRPVLDLEHDLIEIIKYGSKIFTEPDVANKRSKSAKSYKIYARALDNIFEAMEGHRVFQSFGFTLPKSYQSRTPQFQLVNECEQWVYHPEYEDWIDQLGMHYLTGYQEEEA
jgi:hypothetical protein